MLTGSLATESDSGAALNKRGANVELVFALNYLLPVARALDDKLA